MLDKIGLDLKRLEEYNGNLFIVEGDVDKAFLEKFLKAKNLQNFALIYPLNGKENLEKFLKTIYSYLTNIKSLAIFLDMDDKQKKEILDKVNRAISQAFKLNNEIFCDWGVKKVKIDEIDNEILIGIYMFPDCDSKGELEDLLVKLLPNDEKINCIDEIINCLKLTKKTNKLKFHIYYALDEPGISIRSALEKLNIELNHPCFEKLNRFIEKFI